MAAKSPAVKPAPRLSANCAAGRHHLCHGSVYLWPPENGKRFAPCECKSRRCDHGRRDR